MEMQYTNMRRKRVKLIFNPLSGKNKESPVQLMDIIQEMQRWKLAPEPFLFEPGSDFGKVVQDAYAQGIRLFVVCGGDGTVSAVARALYGTTGALGIIPTGTRNNVALSMGIPTDIREAIAILRTGHRLKIDMGVCTCRGVQTPFIEVCSVGLFSKLFSAGDDIQHGKITRIGDFLATFLQTPPSEIRLLLEDKQEITQTGHIVLVTNMTYIGLNNRVSIPDAYCDGRLDVHLFDDSSKLNLVGHFLKDRAARDKEDPRILHFSVRRASIDTSPAMPVMADSAAIGECPVKIEIKRKALTIIAPAPPEGTEAGEYSEP